jgi:hypothetical protein
MQIKWSSLLVKTGIWLCTEVMLNGAGLGDLANYGEFIQHSRSTVELGTALISLGSSIL